jgi:hypothetical protein
MAAGVEIHWWCYITAQDVSQWVYDQHALGPLVTESQSRTLLARQALLVITMLHAPPSPCMLQCIISSLYVKEE